MTVSFDFKGSDWAAEKQQNCAGNEAEYWSKLDIFRSNFKFSIKQSYKYSSFVLLFA